MVVTPFLHTMFYWQLVCLFDQIIDMLLHIQYITDCYF